MGKFQEVNHVGVIKFVKNGVASVQILQKSACLSCEVSGVCSASDSSIKEIEVHVGDQTFEEGENINIIFTRSEGFMALSLGYLLPFMLMFLSMLVIYFWFKDELLAGLISLLILIPYYLTLYFFKDKIRTLFSFKIQNI